MTHGTPDQSESTARDYLQSVKISAYGALEIFAFTRMTGIGVSVYQDTAEGYRQVHHAPGERAAESRRLVWRRPEGPGHFNELKRRRPQESREEVEEDLDCREIPSPTIEHEESQEPAKMEVMAEEPSRKRVRDESPDVEESEMPPRKDAPIIRLWNIGRYPASPRSTQKRRQLQRPAARRTENPRRHPSRTVSPQRNTEEQIRLRAGASI